MAECGRPTIGLTRLLTALKSRGLVPDQHGVFVVDRRTPLTSLDVQTLELACDAGDYDWKYLEDAE